MEGPCFDRVRQTQFGRKRWKTPGQGQLNASFQVINLDNGQSFSDNSVQNNFSRQNHAISLRA